MAKEKEKEKIWTEGRISAHSININPLHFLNSCLWDLLLLNILKKLQLKYYATIQLQFCVFFCFILLGGKIMCFCPEEKI